jgi:excisionase family DNA binding protein
MEELMNVDEVAKILKVHSMTVRRMIYKGELEAHKVGANVRISKENLNKYLNNSKIQSEQEKKAYLKGSVAEEEPKFSTAKSLLKFAGTWSGPKEEYYTILKAIEDSQSDAEF